MDWFLAWLIALLYNMPHSTKLCPALPLWNSASVRCSFYIQLCYWHAANKTSQPTNSAAAVIYIKCMCSKMEFVSVSIYLYSILHIICCISMYPAFYWSWVYYRYFCWFGTVTCVSIATMWEPQSDKLKNVFNLATDKVWEFPRTADPQGLVYY